MSKTTARLLLVFLSFLLVNASASAQNNQSGVSNTGCLMFNYVTSTSAFNTGIAISNVTGDVSATEGRGGKITFYFYDRFKGLVGKTETALIEPGKGFVDLVSNILPTGVTTFSGYIYVKAEFKPVMGFAFISDSALATLAAGVLPIPWPDNPIVFPSPMEKMEKKEGVNN